MQYVYDNNSKNKCWYLNICNKSKCDSFCLRHYKMDYLVYLTTMEGKQKYPIESDQQIAQVRIIWKKKKEYKITIESILKHPVD